VVKRQRCGHPAGEALEQNVGMLTGSECVEGPMQGKGLNTQRLEKGGKAQERPQLKPRGQ
jgi:hypothetical protein